MRMILRSKQVEGLSEKLIIRSYLRARVPARVTAIEARHEKKSTLFLKQTVVARKPLNTQRCYGHEYKQRAREQSCPSHTYALCHRVGEERKGHRLLTDMQAGSATSTARNEKNYCPRPAKHTRASLCALIITHNEDGVPTVGYNYVSEARSSNTIPNIELLHGVELINQTTLNTSNNSSLKEITNQTSYNSNDCTLTYVQLKNKIGSPRPRASIAMFIAGNRFRLPLQFILASRNPALYPVSTRESSMVCRIIQLTIKLMISVYLMMHEMLIRLITQSKFIRIRFEYTNRNARPSSSRALVIDVMFIRYLPYGTEERRNHGGIGEEQARNAQSGGYAACATNTHYTPATRTYATMLVLRFEATHGSAHTHTNLGLKYKDTPLYCWFYHQWHMSGRGTQAQSSLCNPCTQPVMTSRRAIKETCPSSNTEAKKLSLPSPRLLPPSPPTDMHTHNGLARDSFGESTLTRSSAKVAPPEGFAIPLLVFEEVGATGDKAEMPQGPFPYATKKTTILSPLSTTYLKAHKQPRPSWSAPPRSYVRVRVREVRDTYASPHLHEFRQNVPLKPAQKVFMRLILRIAPKGSEYKRTRDALLLAPIPSLRGGDIRTKPKRGPSRTRPCFFHSLHLPPLLTCSFRKQWRCLGSLLNASFQKNFTGPSQYLQAYKAQGFDSLTVIGSTRAMHDINCTPSLPPTHHQHGIEHLGSSYKQWQGTQEFNSKHRIRVCHLDPYVKANCRSPPPTENYVFFLSKRS